MTDKNKPSRGLECQTSQESSPAKPNSKLNTRQHLVLINALKGMNQTDAYSAVYGKDDNYFNLAQRASNLFNNVNFKTALDNALRLEEDKLQESLLSDSEKRSILAKIARAELTDFLKDGKPHLDKSVPNSKAAKEFYHKVKLDREGNPIVTSSIKLADAIEAIREDNKMMGSYAPSKHMIAKRVVFDIVFEPKNKEEHAIQRQVKEIGSSKEGDAEEKEC